jgi:hypothetical protein
MSNGEIAVRPPLIYDEVYTKSDVIDQARGLDRIMMDYYQFAIFSGQKAVLDIFYTSQSANNLYQSLDPETCHKILHGVQFRIVCSIGSSKLRILYQICI